MWYSLACGNGHLSVDLDTLGRVEEVTPKSAVASYDVDGEVMAVLEHPFEAEAPSRALTDSSSLAIVVDEPSRLFPARSLLESVMSYTRGLGVGPANVTIFVAHRVGSVHSESEINRLLGNPISNGHTLVFHNPDEMDSLSGIGETPSFHTPLEINRAFLQADYRIGLGAIAPDPFVGATGGGTSVLPGVSGQKTIVRNMKLRVSTENGPLNTACPSNIDIVEASYLAGLDFILDTVPDWKGSVACVIGGDPSAAWQRGMDASRAISSTNIGRMADIVFVSAGGYPFDRTLYESVNCLYTALRCSRYDGVIVLVAECAEGLGPTGFEKGLFQAKSEKDVLAAGRTRFEVGMEKSRLLRQVTDTRKLVICSELKKPILEERLVCTLANDVTEALEVAKSHVGSQYSTAILPNGAATLVQGS